MISNDSNKIKRDFLAGKDSVAGRLRTTTASAVVSLTDKRSHWLKDICPVCLHTFRVGDRVEINEEGDIRHNHERLGCMPDASASAAEQPAAANSQVLDFLVGASSLARAKELPYVRFLNAGDPLVAMPEGQFQRYGCAVCGHTLRPGETVLICPCDAHQNRSSGKCKVAMHDDVANGLYCYGNWLASREELFCPAFLRKISEKA